jgi:hypothetical protein
MARKKRRFEQLEAAAATVEPKDKKRYQDAFQERVGATLEDAGKKIEGQGRNVLYGLAALVVLIVLVSIFYAWNRRTNSAAQLAFGKAIETSQALVSASPQPAGSSIKTFKTDKDRAQAAVNEFQAITDKFGGAVRSKKLNTCPR